jgi:hypothetical protein
MHRSCVWSAAISTANLRAANRTFALRPLLAFAAKHGRIRNQQLYELQFGFLSSFFFEMEPPAGIEPATC